MSYSKSFMIICIAYNLVIHMLFQWFVNIHISYKKIFNSKFKKAFLSFSDFFVYTLKYSFLVKNKF